MAAQPVTGELARLELEPGQTSEKRLEATLWLQPGAAVAAAHVHDRLGERFEVLAGEVGFLLCDRRAGRRPLPRAGRNRVAGRRG